MRSGHLLAEESPQNLLTLHGLPSLEDVFLKLSRVEHNKKHGARTASGRTIRSIDSHDEGHDNAAYIQTEDNPDANLKSKVNILNVSIK